jgi:membrane protein
MATKHSPEPDSQGAPQPSGGERARGSHWSSPRSNESEMGFENREDYKPGPKRPAFFVLRRTVREFISDGGTDLAAALTYYSVLAIFPALIALMALLGVFGQTQESIDAIIEILAPLVTDDTRLQWIEDTLTDLASMEGAGVTVILGLLGALWAASGYVGAFSRAMNRIYEVTEGRPWWRMRPMQVVVTVTNVVLCATALVILIVSGPVAESVGNAIGVGDELVMIWDWAKWPVLALVVMVIVALLYYATPNVDFIRFRVISVGAFVAILVWLVASIGFAFYVASFGSYNKTYGSVAGVVIALLWLWITNLALLFGAELDAELERGRELQLGIAAEEALQLPVRDTRGIQKAAAREARDLARMRKLRLASATPGDPADRPFARS